jgi:class 3 adenylate cyclase
MADHIEGVIIMILSDEPAPRGTPGMARRLAAILSADVAAYSRLMGEDEEATVRTVTVYRDVIAALVQQHRGRVVDAPGDNLLAEFASVLDAVQCAVAIQRELNARNTALPPPRRMQFRVCPTFYTSGNSASCGPCSRKSATSKERYFIAW